MSKPSRSDLPANKLLCIVGPTASGKTGLAVKLSKLFPNILISADSRQVYQEMDIVTGKDHPANIKIIGLDIISPDQDCSVAVWHRAVISEIQESWQAGRLPIVVGGTGLYIKSLTEGVETMNIPRDSQLRTEIELLSVSQLQARLSSHDHSKLTSLNKSDINNPRRLVRAIEVAIHKKSSKVNSDQQAFTPPDSFIIGLRHPNQEVYKKSVIARVESRVSHGALDETRELIKKYSPDTSSFTSLGYKYLIQYLNKSITKEEMIRSWAQSEISYAKRQLTWFSKVENITWFDAQNQQIFSEVAPLVKAWYSN